MVSKLSLTVIFICFLTSSFFSQEYYSKHLDCTFGFNKTIENNFISENSQRNTKVNVVSLAFRKRFNRYLGLHFTGSFENYAKQILIFYYGDKTNKLYTYNTLDLGISGDIYIYTHQKINVYSSVGVRTGITFVDREYIESPYYVTYQIDDFRLISLSSGISAALNIDYQFSRRFGAKLSYEYRRTIPLVLFGIDEEYAYNTSFPQVGITFNLQK